METTRATMIERMLTSDSTANGQFIVGVRTTKIYCLPSCRPPRKPKPENVTFYRTIDEARGAGLRACKLCKPDAWYAANVPEAAATNTSRIAYVDTVSAMPTPCTFAIDATGAVLRLQFLDGHYPQTLEDELARDGYEIARDPARTASVRDQIAEYSDGTRQDFDLPLVFAGSPWQNEVWRALTTIPFGETRSYGEIATRLGKPGAARAVGRANATNPIPLLVPCHRVVGTNGALTGFGGGLHLKTRLLGHESRQHGEFTAPATPVATN